MQSKNPASARFLSALLALALLSSPALADVTLQRKTATASDPWAKRFAEGTLCASTTVSPGDEVVPLELGSSNFIAQSFLGNDAYLRGVAFYGGGLNSSPLEYTVTLLDYGPRPPVMTLADFNPTEAAVVVVVGTFRLAAESTAQLYLAFDGPDSAFLRKNHAYVIMIASTRDSSARFYRTVTDDLYLNGTGAIGPMRLNPDSFSVKGSRDLLFAVYTATFER